MASGPTARGEASRARLVDAMRERVQRDGCGATGVGDVLADTGLPKGSLYHHFPGGKEELVAAAVTSAGAQIDAAFAAVLDATPDPALAVTRLAELLAVQLERSAFTRGCPVATVALETAHASDRIAGAAAGAFGTWRDRLAAHLTAAGVPAAVAAQRAVLVLSALEGALVLARAGRDAAPLRSVAVQLGPLLDSKQV